MFVKVSIAVPIFRTAQFIKRCAESLFLQTYDNIEYVFVDDKSPDESISILERLISKYPDRIPNIRIIRHPINRGLSAARNTAVSECSGDFIIHVDSDDYLELDAVERLVNLQIETKADIVSGDAIGHTPTGIISFNEPDYQNKYSMLKNLVSSMNNHMIWGRLIRRSLYIEHKIMAEEGCNVGEDWQTLVPLTYYAKEIAHLKYTLYHYNCENPNSFMAQKNGHPTINEAIFKQDYHSLEIVKDFVKSKDVQLYKLIKHTGKRFAHESMDSCVRVANLSLYHYIVQRLNSDSDYYDRSQLERLIDSNYFLYKIIYYFRKVLIKIKPSRPFKCIIRLF